MRQPTLQQLNSPLTIGRQNSVVRFPDALEFAIAALIIVIALLGMLSAGRIAMMQAQETEGVQLATDVEQRLLAFRAQHGDWPPAGFNIPAMHYQDNPNTPIGRFVISVQVESAGAFTFVYDSAMIPFTAGHRLTFRPVHINTPGQEFVYWVCGYHHPPPESVLTGTNETDIAPFEVPFTCR